MDKKKILIIDDEEGFCGLVKKNIEKTGEFEVYTATNGEDGIKAARNIQPDLILLDIIMPGMDGSDVASLIKNDEIIGDTPIVFLTAIIREEEAGSQTNLTGGYALLAKTATLGELIACIKKNARL